MSAVSTGAQPLRVRVCCAEAMATACKRAQPPQPQACPAAWPRASWPAPPTAGAPALFIISRGGKGCVSLRPGIRVGEGLGTLGTLGTLHRSLVRAGLVLMGAAGPPPALGSSAFPIGRLVPSPGSPRGPCSGPEAPAQGWKFVWAAKCRAWGWQDSLGQLPGAGRAPPALPPTRTLCHPCTVLAREAWVAAGRLAQAGPGRWASVLHASCQLGPPFSACPVGVSLWLPSLPHMPGRLGRHCPARSPRSLGGSV